MSVPIASIPAFLDAALAELAVSLLKGQPITYGHVGDGNIHLNIVPPPHWSKEERYVLFERAETLIFETVDRFGGSISAEHGIGRSKRRAFLERVDPVTLASSAGSRAPLMQTIASARDAFSTFDKSSNTTVLQL